MGHPANHRSGVEVVAFLVVLGEVEALGFVGGGDAHAYGLVDQEEQHESADDGQRPTYPHADGLVDDLMPVTVDGASGKGDSGGVFAEDGVDGAGGKQAGEQSAHGSTNAVNAKGVEGVVEAQALFNIEDH